MSGRNPYAAPAAPVIAADEPTLFANDPGSFEYGGFWRRVGAALIDWIILIPMSLLLFFLMFTTSRAYLYFALPNIVVTLFYFVYLVKRFGGTPGKRITGMRITMTDGSPLTLKATLLRFAPFFVFQALSMAVMAWASRTPIAGFESLNFIEKMQTMQSRAPRWNVVITWISCLWWIATAITLGANDRKRAAHDFLAGTIVLRTG